MELTASEIHALIERALERESFGPAHTAADVIAGIERGEFQLWPGERSVIITQIQDYPRKRALCCFVAAGEMLELQDMLPSVLEWAREQGCTTAFLVGRHGWQRSFLAREGWRATATVMETDLGAKS